MIIIITFSSPAPFPLLILRGRGHPPDATTTTTCIVPLASSNNLWRQTLAEAAAALSASK